MVYKNRDLKPGEQMIPGQLPDNTMRAIESSVLDMVLQVPGIVEDACMIEVKVCVKFDIIEGSMNRKKEQS